MKRREFVASCGTLMAAGLINRTCLGIDPFVRSKPSRLGLSLAAYSLRKYLTLKKEDPKSMNLFQFVDYCHQHGLGGTELTSYYFPEQVTDEYLVDLKAHCHRQGVTISGGAIRNDFCQMPGAKLDADQAHTRKWVDYYAKIGAPVIRIFAGEMPRDSDLESTRQRCVKACEVACTYAAQQGVYLALENHGGITATAEGLLAIVRNINAPAFGVNFDSGNFRSTSDPYAELAQIAPYAVNAQIKVEMFPGGKREVTDLKRTVQILRDSGYSGWVALEYESNEEPLEAIPRWLDILRKLLDA